MKKRELSKTKNQEKLTTLFLVLLITTSFFSVLTLNTIPVNAQDIPLPISDLEQIEKIAEKVGGKCGNSYY
jgi:hypothetical protein